MRIQKIASRDHGHTIGSSDWSNLCDDLDAIYGVAYNTIRDFPLEREPQEDSAPRDETPAEVIEVICEAMHDAYEKAAIENSWVTQEMCQVPYDELPPENKATMRKAARAAIEKFQEVTVGEPRGEARPKDKLRAALWLMRRAIQRDDPVTLTPSEARALLALAGPQGE